jgi:hypothetical protein
MDKKKTDNNALCDLSSCWLVIYLTTFFSNRLQSVDDRMISEWWWSAKDLVGSGRGLIFKVLDQNSTGGTEKTYEKSQ